MAAPVSVSPGSSREGVPGASQDPGVLSGLDSQLFQCLQADGRTSYSALARKLGISEVTVRRRVARLIEDGVFTITAVADPRLLGLDQMAWTALSVRPLAGIGSSTSQRWMKPSGAGALSGVVGRISVTGATWAAAMAPIASRNTKDVRCRVMGF